MFGRPSTITIAVVFSLGAVFAAPALLGRDAAAAAPKVNACGCYQDDAGNCVCTSKRMKCVCPGECEPVGCDDKRRKLEEKAAATEIKKQKELAKKQRASDARKAARKK